METVPTKRLMPKSPSNCRMLDAVFLGLIGNSLGETRGHIENLGEELAVDMLQFFRQLSPTFQIKQEDK